jgi:tetratricopeptide (TPR) repeat protein
MTADSYHSRVNALLRAGENDQAVAILAVALAKHATEHGAWHLLSVAQTQRRRHADALKAIKRALALAPDELLYQQQHGFTLVNLRRFEAAIGVLLPVVRKLPDDYPTMRGLQVAYYQAGKYPHAIALGRKLLKFEDGTVMSIAGESPSADIMPIARGDARVISFALPDANPLSGVGAIANAKLVQRLYPGWKCRLYAGQTVPVNIRAALRQHGAEIVEAWEQLPDVPPALWPYVVADDPGVAVFLCRSVGARLGEKEAAAVDAWLRSGRRAHVMRDHILHRNLVLPGLWGARTDNALFVTARIQRFMAAYGNPPNGREQRFLDGEIWPAIRDDCLIHDSYYPLFGAQPFPAMGKGNDRFHVGMGITEK